MSLNTEIKNSTDQIFNKISNELKYSYNFEWFGRPIIQYPQDMIALQEIVFNIKPDLINSSTGTNSSGL
mgnify:CR=1 FL=1